MVLNPLFIQNNSSRDSAMLAKTGGLKGKGYLFSDMMQVYLGSKAGAPTKFEQLLSSNAEIDADETKSNLFKLTEGNIPSQNDVKFELLLKFLGVTSEEFPEQTGLSLEIPKVSAEELQSILAKITANADNEGELNKVIDEKLLKSSEENGENLLVTLQFNNKTIAIDIVPGAAAAVNNPNQTGASEVASSGKPASVYNMTVSILPSEVSDNIISKFIDSTHLLKKEAEGTAQISSQESKKTKLIQNNEQMNLGKVQAKSQIDNIISKASETTPDLAKKITIYSVVSNGESTESDVSQKSVETTFTNPLKQIKLNNQTASLNSSDNTNKVNVNVSESSSNKGFNLDSQIPKAGNSFVPDSKIKEADSKVDVNVKSTDNNVLKESDAKNNVQKPVIENFSDESKIIASSPEKSKGKETISSQVLNNLVSGSDKKNENQNNFSVKVDNSQQNTKNNDKAATVNTNSLNETELEIPSNEKVKISIKKESATVKTETPVVKPKVTKEMKPSINADGKAVESTKQTAENVKPETPSLKSETASVKPSINTDGKAVESTKQTAENAKPEAPSLKSETAQIKSDQVNTKIATDSTAKSNGELAQDSDKKTDSVLAKEFEKTLKNNAENKNADINNTTKEKSEKNSEPIKVTQENSSAKSKDETVKVNKALENTVAKEKTEEIVKENPVKPSEVVKAKTEAEPDKPVTSTTAKDGDILREISGTNGTSSEHKHSHKQGDDNQPNNFLHQTHNVDSVKPKAGFDEAMANNQAHKVVKQSEVVKEVHQFVERKDSSQLVLKVEPADLGKVKVTLEMADKIVKVHVEVESEVIKQALEKSMSDLSQQLNKSGLQLGSVNISLQNADKGNKQNQPNKKKTNNKADGGDIVENETGEAQAGKSLGYNTYDYVV